MPGPGFSTVPTTSPVSAPGTGRNQIESGSRLAAELDVDVVDADRLGADEDLPGAGLGNGGLLDGQDLGAPVRVVADAPHE